MAQRSPGRVAAAGGTRCSALRFLPRLAPHGESVEAELAIDSLLAVSPIFAPKGRPSDACLRLQMQSGSSTRPTFESRSRRAPHLHYGRPMGLEVEYLRFIEEQCELIGGLRGKKMLELGDQTISAREIPEETGKAYFENRGVAHVSFDLNGENGSLRVDLSRPIDRQYYFGLVSDARWISRFDIVTNAGTSEHVEPLEAQYECFKSIHRCLRVGGVAIHIVPDVDELDKHGQWDGHCNFYYSETFFQTLGEANDYRILNSCVLNGHRCVALEKTCDAEFMADRKALLAQVAVRGKGIVYPGINDGRIPWPLRRLALVLLRVSRPLRLRLGLHRRS